MRRPRDARPVLEWPQDRSAGSASPYRQFYPIRVVSSTLSGDSALGERSHMSVKSLVGLWRTATQNGCRSSLVAKDLPKMRRGVRRSEEHTSELQSLRHLVC